MGSSAGGSSPRPGLVARERLPALPVRDEVIEDAPEPLDLTTLVATPRSLAYTSL